MSQYGTISSYNEEMYFDVDDEDFEWDSDPVYDMQCCNATSRNLSDLVGVTR
jgi:hypothetical protein